MKKTFLVAVVLGVAMAGQAFAFECPSLMKQIDEKLPGASLSAEQMRQVKSDRADGEKHHKAGQHKEAVEALNSALKILGA